MTTSAADPAGLYLVLDQGGGSSRALLFDHRGTELACAQQKVLTRHPGPDRVEQDPAQLLQSLKACIDRLLSSLPSVQRQRIRSWGLACQRSNLLALSRHSGTPLTPVLSWQDLRARDRIDWTPALVRQIHQLCGLFPSDHHGAAKFRWCLQQPELDSMAASGQLLLTPLSGYLAAGLTGWTPNSGQPLRLDHACAQRTLLWNRQTLDWDPALLQRFQIPPQHLPSLQHCEANWGLLHWRDLSIPGRFVGGDQGCAHFAQGQPESDQVTVTLGTGAFISVALGKPIEQPHRLLTSLASSHSEHRDWMLEGTVNGAASALQWLQRQYPSLDLAALQQQPLQPNQGLFLNAVSGLGSPFWNSRIQSRFIDCDHDSERYAALLESILFLIVENLRAIPDTRPQLQQIKLGGGLSRLPGLAQRLADLSGLPVNLIEQHEATARGLAFILAGRPSDWKPSAAQRYQPQPAPQLQQRYRRWQQYLQQALGTRADS
ncbi:FGGY family carbohydrate kinase [Motiliproteus sp.]|uniref:FGGY family carbohydrate kinase n=1 Tax=Motiliproteus sp. TaxID=1898955 RepID=UPI003BAC9B7D